MDPIHTLQPRQLPVRHVALLVAAWLLGACASTGPSNAPVRIEVQQESGFTIVETGRVSGNVRSDYDQALAQLEQGHHARGIALLEAVVEAAPQLSAPRIDLGVAYHQAGDLDTARAHLTQALTANPNHPIAHNELGIVQRKAGQFALARQSYQSALAIYPDFHYARRNLAVLCDLYLADLDCALENYTAYEATVPGDAEVSIWLADLRTRMDQGRK